MPLNLGLLPNGSYMFTRPLAGFQVPPLNPGQPVMSRPPQLVPGPPGLTSHERHGEAE